MTLGSTPLVHIPAIFIIILVATYGAGVGCTCQEVQAGWNVMAHAQKPDFAFRRNERVHLNRRGRQFSRLLATEVCASAVVILDTPCSEVVWRVLATHSIRQFPLHFPTNVSPCAITFQLESIVDERWNLPIIFSCQCLDCVAVCPYASPLSS